MDWPNSRLEMTKKVLRNLNIGQQKFNLTNKEKKKKTSLTITAKKNREKE